MGRKIPETITEEELKLILSSIRSKKKRHHKIAIALGFYNCLRVSEVVKLQKDHVDKGRKLLYIKQAKGSKDRNIPIAPEVMNGLKHLPVGVTRRALQYAFKNKAKSILGKDLHFHTLRHSGATHYLNKRKWNLRQLQQFLGHAKADTTAIYTHVSPENLVEEMWK